MNRVLRNEYVSIATGKSEFNCGDQARLWPTKLFKRIFLVLEDI